MGIAIALKLCGNMEPVDELDVFPSGAKCTQAGVYLSHGCGHAQRKSFALDEVMPNCSICNMPVIWIPKYSSESGIPPKSFLS